MATILVVCGQLAVAVAAVATNVATSLLPSAWEPYLWIAWPVLVLSAAGSTVSILLLRRHDRRVAAAGGASQVGDDTLASARVALMRRVRRIWIDGVLRQSTAPLPRLELRISDQPGAVDHPWAGLIAKEHLLRPAAVSPGMTLTQVHDEVGETLVVLGGPGAGKTTALLQLAEDLLARAEDDAQAPVPVVLQLATWEKVDEHDDLTGWLVRELASQRYRIPTAIGRLLVDRNMILPLLDGLDELKAAHRLECIRSINAFRARHGLMSMVVCVRTATYDPLGSKLSFDRAVLIEPVAESVLDAVLSNGDLQVRGLSEAIGREPGLRQLLQTPLFLKMAVVTYAGRQDLDLANGHRLSPQVRLFQAYVESMAAQRGRPSMYGASSSIRWLSYLARDLARRWSLTFQPGSLSAAWLPFAWQRGVVWGTLRTISGLVTGGAAGVLAGAFFGPVGGCAVGLMVGAFSVTEARRRSYEVISLADGGDATISEGEPDEQSLDKIGHGFHFHGAYVLLCATLWLVAMGALIGIYAIISTLVPGKLPETGQVIWAMSVILLCVALSPALQLFRPFHDSLDSRTLQLGTYYEPGGETLGSLLRRALLPAAGTLVVTAAASAAAVGVQAGLVVGATLALAVLYFAAGREAVHHWLIRILLSRCGHAPLRYRRFLRFAAERGLLAPIADGYMFPHRLILEYFAELDPPELRSPLGLKAHDAPLSLRRAKTLLASNDFSGVIDIFRWVSAQEVTHRTVCDAAELFEAILGHRAPSHRFRHEETVVEIGHWLIKVGDPHWSPAAAVRLARFYEAEMNRGFRREYYRSLALNAYRTAMDSGHDEHSAVAATAHARLTAIDPAG